MLIVILYLIVDSLLIQARVQKKPIQALGARLFLHVHPPDGMNSLTKGCLPVLFYRACFDNGSQKLPDGFEESPLNTPSLWAFEKFTKVAYNHYVYQGLSEQLLQNHYA